MIPLKLTLKNFMSYGEQGETLPFEGLHVACLAGDNGNGKSALLDAITWALWGRTRVSSRAASEDDLIRLGADEAEVRFEFSLNSQQYRVVKKRRRGRSSTGDWQLARADEAGGYVAVSSGGQRETGKLITQLLSMEYETFLNSAYLQQGRADEFTRQTPDSRKRILGEILGLDQYERLEAKAKERFRVQKERAEELASEIRMLENQVAELPLHQERLEQLMGELTEQTALWQQQETRTKTLRDQQARMEAEAQNLQEQEKVCSRAEGELQQRIQECKERDARIQRLRETLQQRDSILKDYGVYQEAQRRREALYPEVEAFNHVLKERTEAGSAIDVERERLQGQITTLEERVRMVERQRQEAARLEKQMAEIQETLRSEAEARRSCEAARNVAETAQEAFQQLRAQNDKLKAEIADIKDVLELLSRPQAVCPVCESDLSGKKQEAVKTRQEAKLTAAEREWNTVKQEGATRKQELTAAQETLKTQETQLQKIEVQRGQYTSLREQWEQKKAELAEAEPSQRELQTLRERLEKEQYAAPQRLRRQRLDQELERLKMVKAEFETVSQTLRNLSAVGQRYEQLKQAEESWERECSERERLEQLIAQKQQETAELRSRLEGQRAKLQRLEEVRRQVAQAEAERFRLQEAVQRLQVQQGSHQRAIAQCEQAESERQHKAAEHKKADQERWLYNQLAAAFGKKGIQTYIIENAIPELADETNFLLQRMTDNALQVQFLTTRASKSTGDAIETLDIIITDEAGTRPYELFSGGEAFRVNFAIRIALSRLLARRSGARLQTLILDEGFGTQDGKGREKLVEALDSIKDDFEKILVITHVEDLKDAFTQRIEITKDTQGSHIHLV